MKRTVIQVFLIIFAATLLHAQNIVGDWQGTLKAGTTDLHVALHITKSDDGSLKGTLDSVDQNANGMPVTSIVLKDSKLSFKVESVQGSYQGKVNSDANTITGTWSQGQELPLEFKRAASAPAKEPKAVKPSDIDGTWSGMLDTGTTKLKAVFHILNMAEGLTATMDSPDQGTNGMAASSVTRDGSSLKIEAKSIGGAFQGTIAANLTSINGTWTQGSSSFPLVLIRTKDVSVSEPRRPQNPVKPYPYREEEVSYENKIQNDTLAATFTIPQGKGPFPAVLLITGSGPQDRDESLFGHKPFLVLSDYLTRHGIAVLRADDRGTGKSTGNFGAATTADFATDTEAGVAYLKTRPEVNKRKIGLIGHSEGGIIAPLVASRNPDIAFIVMMAGSGIPCDEILVAQAELITEAMGKSHDEAAKDAAQEREVLALVKSEKDETVLDKELQEKLAGSVPEAQLGAMVKKVSTPWFRYFLSYDPATALEKVTCPVLALNGEKDLQVPPKQNLPAIRKALEAGGNKHFEADELPGLNHLFQTAKTGSPSEYAGIEETISPVALKKMADWILQQ